MSIGVVAGVPSDFIMGLPINVQAGVLNGVSYSFIFGFLFDEPAIANWSAISFLPSLLTGVLSKYVFFFIQVYYLQYLLLA